MSCPACRIHCKQNSPQPVACFFPHNKLHFNSDLQQWPGIPHQYTRPTAMHTLDVVRDLLRARSFVGGWGIAHLSITCKLALSLTATHWGHASSAADRPCLEPSFPGKLHRRPLLRKLKDMATSVYGGAAQDGIQRRQDSTIIRSTKVFPVGDQPYPTAVREGGFVFDRHGGCLGFTTHERWLGPCDRHNTKC